MIVDANVFLEMLLRQRDHRACKSFLDGVRRGERTVHVTAYHVDAVACIIGETTEGGSDIMSFLGSLMVYDGLSLLDQPIVEKIRACRITGDEGLDLDDSLSVRAARSTESDAIVTLDGDFDSVSGVETMHPADV